MIVLIVLVLCFVIIGGAVVYYIKKKRDDDAAAADDAANAKAMKQKVPDDPDFFAESTGVTVDCQNLSNTKLGWPGHKGLTPIEDWGNFNFQKCSTYPTAYTSNKALFSTFYTTLGQGSPKHDPALTDQQSLDNSGNYSVENIISKGKLEFSSTGVLSLKNSSGATLWSTPGGASGTYTLKFDQDTYNNGNLCIFDKNGNKPWCMLPKVTVSTTSTTGGDLAATQQQQLSSGNLKNNSDQAHRFVMIDDSGQFCMYRGTPGNEQGAPIVCK